MIDADLPEGLTDQWLSAIEGFLPAFLAPSAEEESEVVEDLERLLNLDEEDLKQVVAVHVCLDHRVQRLRTGLRRGLRQPVIDTDRPAEMSQAIRGGIDWGRTIRSRTQLGGIATSFVVRSATRVYDTPENRVLVWVLNQLQSAVDRTNIPKRRTQEESNPEAEAEYPLGWEDKILALDAEVRTARRTHWLESVPPERPDPVTIESLRASRNPFYARDVFGAVQSLLEFANTRDRASVVEALRQRYFKPASAWRLFEVYIALKLFDGFANSSAVVKRLRKIEGIGSEPYAVFELENGEMVKLFSQGWPTWIGPRSLRREVADRHELAKVSSHQDLFLERRGADTSGLPSDCVVLELKASRRAGTLSDGLSQLLGYLGDFQVLQQFQPVGWLVAPKSEAFVDAAPDSDSLLWMVSAHDVVDAAVERLGNGG